MDHHQHHPHPHRRAPSSHRSFPTLQQPQQQQQLMLPAAAPEVARARQLSGSLSARKKLLFQSANSGYNLQQRHSTEPTTPNNKQQPIAKSVSSATYTAPYLASPYPSPPSSSPLPAPLSSSTSSSLSSLASTTTKSSSSSPEGRGHCAATKEDQIRGTATHRTSAAQYNEYGTPLSAVTVQEPSNTNKISTTRDHELQPPPVTASTSTPSVNTTPTTTTPCNSQPLGGTTTVGGSGREQRSERLRDSEMGLTAITAATAVAPAEEGEEQDHQQWSRATTPNRANGPRLPPPTTTTATSTITSSSFSSSSPSPLPLASSSNHNNNDHPPPSRAAAAVPSKPKGLITLNLDGLKIDRTPLTTPTSPDSPQSHIPGSLPHQINSTKLQLQQLSPTSLIGPEQSTYKNPATTTTPIDPYPTPTSTHRIGDRSSEPSIRSVSPLSALAPPSHEPPPSPARSPPTPPSVHNSQLPLTPPVLAPSTFTRIPHNQSLEAPEDYHRRNQQAPQPVSNYSSTSLTPHPSKTLLTTALAKAQAAVLLDTSLQIPEAIEAYTQAVFLLEEVIDKIEELANEREQKELQTLARDKQRDRAWAEELLKRLSDDNIHEREREAIKLRLQERDRRWAERHWKMEKRKKARTDEEDRLVGIHNTYAGRIRELQSELACARESPSQLDLFDSDPTTVQQFTTPPLPPSQPDSEQPYAATPPGSSSTKAANRELTSKPSPPSSAHLTLSHDNLPSSSATTELPQPVTQAPRRKSSLNSVVPSDSPVEVRSTLEPRPDLAERDPSQSLRRSSGFFDRPGPAARIKSSAGRQSSNPLDSRNNGSHRPDTTKSSLYVVDESNDTVPNYLPSTVPSHPPPSVRDRSSSSISGASMSRLGRIRSNDSMSTSNRTSVSSTAYKPDQSLPPIPQIPPDNFIETPLASISPTSSSHHRQRTSLVNPPVDLRSPSRHSTRSSRPTSSIYRPESSASKNTNHSSASTSTLTEGSLPGHNPSHSEGTQKLLVSSTTSHGTISQRRRSPSTVETRPGRSSSDGLLINEQDSDLPPIAQLYSNSSSNELFFKNSLHVNRRPSNVSLVNNVSAAIPLRLRAYSQPGKRPGQPSFLTDEIAPPLPKSNSNFAEPAQPSVQQFMVRKTSAPTASNLISTLIPKETFPKSAGPIPTFQLRPTSPTMRHEACLKTSNSFATNTIRSTRSSMGVAQSNAGGNNHFLPPYAHAFTPVVSMGPGGSMPPTGELPPYPTMLARRPFHLMQQIRATILTGAYVSSRLYVPKQMWSQTNVKLNGLENKIKLMETLMTGLEMIEKDGRVLAHGHDEVSSAEQSKEIMINARGPSATFLNETERFMKRLELFEDSITTLQGGLAKKLGLNIANQSETAYGQDAMKKGGGFGNLAQKLGKGLDRITNGRSTADLPVTYVEMIARLFERSQVIDLHLGCLDINAKKSGRSNYRMVGQSSKSQIEGRLKRVSEFYSTVVCRFVVADMGVLLDKYVKRGGTWCID